MRARARAAGKGGVVVTGEDDRDKNERPMLGLRTKKATGVRTWLLIDIHGSAQVCALVLLWLGYLHFVWNGEEAKPFNPSRQGLVSTL